MKYLCIADTSSLINLSKLELANSSLHEWLWKEFEVRYSKVVLNEIKSQKEKMGSDGSSQRWDNYVWEYSTISTCERALFKSPWSRTVFSRKCRECKQTIWKNEQFCPDLADRKDRGERHNCCITLNAVVEEGKHSQAIFLTDDSSAVSDYDGSFFSTFPICQIWTSLDFVLYLFLRHKRRMGIKLEVVKAVLRDVNARCPGNTQARARRLTSYYEKVRQINGVLDRI